MFSDYFQLSKKKIKRKTLPGVFERNIFFISFIIFFKKKKESREISLSYVRAVENNTFSCRTCRKPDDLTHKLLCLDRKNMNAELKQMCQHFLNE